MLCIMRGSHLFSSTFDHFHNGLELYREQFRTMVLYDLKSGSNYRETYAHSDAAWRKTKHLRTKRLSVGSTNMSLRNGMSVDQDGPELQ